MNLNENYSFGMTRENEINSFRISFQMKEQLNTNS